MHIIYRRPDGGTTLVTPASIEDLRRVVNLETQQDYLDYVFNNSVPDDALDAKWVDDAEADQDHDFFNAWKWDGVKLDYYLDKAKDIQLDKIRKARNPKLAELDREYMLADEKADDAEKARVAAKKQALRDITEPLKALTPASIDDIKNAFPESLR